MTARTFRRAFLQPAALLGVLLLGALLVVTAHHNYWLQRELRGLRDEREELQARAVCAERWFDRSLGRGTIMWVTTTREAWLRRCVGREGAK